MAAKGLNYSIRDLVIALLRDQNIHTGFWGLTMHFTANGTSVAKAEQSEVRLPGLAIAVSGLTLVPTKDGEEGSIDAAQVNPSTKVRSSKGSKALH